MYSWTVNTLPLGTGSSDLGVNHVLPNDTVGCYATAVDSSGATHTDSASVNSLTELHLRPLFDLSGLSSGGLDDLVCTASGSGPDEPNAETATNGFLTLGFRFFQTLCRPLYCFG